MGFNIDRSGLHATARAAAMGLCLGLWAVAGMAQTAPDAGSATPDTSNATPEIGSATRRLLATQAASNTAPRPITGNVATLSYQRYLDSFKQPIPATSMATHQPRTGTGSK